MKRKNYLETRNRLTSNLDAGRFLNRQFECVIMELTVSEGTDQRYCTRERQEPDTWVCWPQCIESDFPFVAKRSN